VGYLAWCFWFTKGSLRLQPNLTDTILALATPPGLGAIGVIRVSGSEAFPLVASVFRGKDITKLPSHTVHLGTLHDGETVLDEVLVTLFRAPNSYTKEDVIEISCHGSTYIIRQIIQLLIGKGARMALPGEFTQRAFLNGRFDLTQAEAVADLIASETEGAHRAAINQMRGGFAHDLQHLRDELIHFASMVELELDFGEEDVEFANRDQLHTLVVNIRKAVRALIDSFRWGNVLKNGVPVVIAGKPNAGKSTLLNALLNEQRAIVSAIPGTTRDVIEDIVTLEGITFRFIDTAGLRDTTDEIEAIGVQRTQAKLKEADLVIYMTDLSSATVESITTELQPILKSGKPVLTVGNKCDLVPKAELAAIQSKVELLPIAAGKGKGIEQLKKKLVELVCASKVPWNQTIVTNSRHYESLVKTDEALGRVLNALDTQITGDLLALDIRQALYHLGEITGSSIGPDDLLANIFSRFCIGK
jgi:tRNA modification GTPase